MAEAQSIILHQFARSPFSEKIRLALRIKNIDWVAVDVPVVLPKPDLMPLTGGYRRTPVLQLGADVFCDTSIMLEELDQRSPDTRLERPGHEGLSKMVAAWCNGKWFQTSVSVVFGAVGDQMPQAFVDDRTKMMGRPFDVKAMKTAAPFFRDQWRSQLMWIEERLKGGRRAGEGDWLMGAEPGTLDVHAFMNPWFVEKNVPDFLKACFEAAPETKDWYHRLREIKGQGPEKMTSAQAVEIAQSAEPCAKTATVAGEFRSLQVGDRVAVAPDDYAKDWVTGDLV
ncbi:MAG: glutathione S-transferase family protein, partial [Myxococcota bacterium]